jgi:hypothetical protein
VFHDHVFHRSLLRIEAWPWFCEEHVTFCLLFAVDWKELEQQYGAQRGERDLDEAGFRESSWEADFVMTDILSISVGSCSGRCPRSGFREKIGNGQRFLLMYVTR